MARGRKPAEDNVLITRKSQDTENDMIAMTREFNRALLYATDYLKWSPLQKKIFTLILGEIDWRTERDNSFRINLSSEQIMKELDWDYADGNERNATAIINKELSHMITHSGVKVADPYTGDWVAANIFLGGKGKLGSFTVEINPLFMPHIENLYVVAKDAKKPFIQYVKPDLVSFKCKYSAPLFSELCSCAVIGNNVINKHKIKVSRLRSLFALENTDYSRPSKAKGSNPKTDRLFDRYNFEKRVLFPAVEDINKTEMLKLIPYEDGLYFRRVKSGAQIFEYEFQYKVLNDKEVYNHRKKIELLSKNQVNPDDELTIDELNIIEAEEANKIESVNIIEAEELEYTPETIIEEKTKKKCSKKRQI